MRLPTVKLRRGDEQLILNVFDYQKDIAYWTRKGWRIKHENTRVDTPDSEVDWFIQQGNIEDRKKRNPKKPAYWDKKKDFEGRKIAFGIDTTENLSSRKVSDKKDIVDEAKKAVGRNTTRRTSSRKRTSENENE